MISINIYNDFDMEKEWENTWSNVLKQKTLNKEESKKLLLIVYDHLSKLGIKPLIGFGTLLGIVRQQDLISYDVDIDFIIREQDCEYLENALLTLPKEYKVLRQSKHLSFGDLFFSIGNDVCYLDIYIYVSKSNEMYTSVWFEEKFDIKKTDFDNCCLIEFLGRTFLTVNNYEQYLEKWYGNDWRVHKKHDLSMYEGRV